MTVSITELVASRDVSITSAGVTSERVFHAETNNPELAFLNLPQELRYGYEHPTMPNMIVTNVNIKPLLIKGESSKSLCLVTVSYGLPTIDNRANSEGEIWEWSFTSQQNRITSVTSASRQRSFPPIQDAGTAIGVKGNDVQGVSVYQPTQRLRVTKEYQIVSTHLRENIKACGAHTNQGVFGVKGTTGYQPGEVLFLGAEIAPASDIRWRVIFEFLLAKNPGTMHITSIWDTDIEVTDVKAWNYIWYKHSRRLIRPSGGRQMWKAGIESVHVAQVYDTYNFAHLKIGRDTDR